MDQKLKQRLTGAIVLVALAVIFVPIILEGPDNEWTPRSHSIPEQPPMDYRADMELAIPDRTEEATSTPAETGGVITEALGLPESGETMSPSETDETPVARTDSAETPVAAEKPSKPPAQSTATAAPAPKPAAKQPDRVIEGWFVQVGSFGQEMNASGLQDRLKAAGYPTRLQKVSIGNGHAYRVLVGPSGSRAEAEKTASSLKQRQQLAGMVIEYP